jgi:5-bromo-4-chloroindolyl phosphate hydrolysis protein
MLDSIIKNKDFFFGAFETMVIMAHYSFLTHMNVKKIKLNIHLIQFQVLV